MGRSKQAAHLKTSLSGGAGLLLCEIQDATYEDITEKLRRRYGSREQQEKFRTELKYRRRKVGESLQELAQDVERITVLAYPAAVARLCRHEEMKVDPTRGSPVAISGPQVSTP